MKKLSFKLSPTALRDSGAIPSATPEELRTLLAVISTGGASLDCEELAATAGISRSRAAAAITFWREEGVISENTDTPCKENGAITEEFEERLRRGELCESTSLESARTIRDERLASLIEEIARLMKKDSLSTSEIKIITGLISEYSLTPEYLLLLAAHIASTGALTATKLRDRAIFLATSEVDTLEELEKYIEASSRENDVHREFRSIMGLYSGALSPTQKKYFTRWGIEFGFSSAIVSEAYDRAAVNAGGSIKYMDKILTSWHEAGCKTLSECLAHSAEHKAGEQKSTARAKPRSKPAPTRYGDFDVDEAFAKALERSYGDEEK